MKFLYLSEQRSNKTRFNNFIKHFSLDNGVDHVQGELFPGLHKAGNLRAAFRVVLFLRFAYLCVFLCFG